MDLKQVQQRLRHADLSTTLAAYVEEVDTGRTAVDMMGGSGDTVRTLTSATRCVRATSLG
jgi:hypothetical protein